MSMSKFVSRLKGESFIIDSAIPSFYLFRFFITKGLSMLYGMIRLLTFTRVFIHPSSTIVCSSKFRFGKNLSVGRGCYIDALSIDGLSTGYNVSIGKFSCIECTGSLKKMGKGICIGNNVGLGTHGYFGGAGGVSIGDDCIFGNYVSIHPENHIFSKLDIPIRLQGTSQKGITIGNNCWIGAKAMFLDGSSIGNGCIVAAGAIVTKNFPDNCIIGGIPAHIIKYRQL